MRARRPTRAVADADARAGTTRCAWEDARDDLKMAPFVVARRARASMSAYEAERAARIEANRARMAELGVVRAKRALETGGVKRRREVLKNTCDSTRAPTRTSRRQRREAPENFTVDDLARARELIEIEYAEETYERRHVEALAKAPERAWTLFVDGYDEKGRRIYDPGNWECCHQCRQKTKGLRTRCAGCEMMRGVYCGDCLWMRQGQNIREAIARGDAWRCPSCLDICNCSFCRTKKGYAPTGAMYRRALAMGYDSVAHYLVLTNQKDEAARDAAKREAEVKAAAYAKAEAETHAMAPLDTNSPEVKRPHWLEPKVYAAE